MRVKFIIGNDGVNMWDLNYETDLPIIPREGEPVSVMDFLPEDDLQRLINGAKCWSGDDAQVMITTLRKDEDGWYYQIWLNCEDW